MSLRSKINRRLLSVRINAIECVGRVRLSLSTAQSRRYLRSNGSLSLLVDTSVFAHAITHETAWISTGTAKWGNEVVGTGYAARIPVHSPANTGRTYKEIRYLAGIVHLARLGHLQLFTSKELGAERIRQPAGRFVGYSCYDLNLFSGLSIKSVDGPPFESLGAFDRIDPKAEQLRRIDSCVDPLYPTLARYLGKKGSLDAFHVLTAERYGIFGFLHIDFPLSAKVACGGSPLSQLKTKVLLPSELAKIIKLCPLDTSFISYEGSSFPVRSDLHWDDQRRRRPR